MGFTEKDLTSKQSTTAVAPEGNSNTVSDAVAQQQKETEKAFNDGLVSNNSQGGGSAAAPTSATPSSAIPTPTNTAASEGNSNTISDAVAQQQKETEEAFNEGLVNGNGQGVSFTQQPSAEDAAVQKGQGLQIDWSKPYSEIENNPILQQMKPYDILRDYQKNGKGDYVSFMPWLQSLGDVDKTVADNAAARKKADKQAKWEQWGNLFQHMGNFFGTALGAPEQKVESATDLTERQRKIRESTDALRQKGYDQLMVNIYKDRAGKQAQMKAEAYAKANDALAKYRGSQKNQVDALTPEKVKTEQARQAASAAAAGLSTAKTKTEDALRDKKGKLLSARTNDANAGVAVKGAQVKHLNSQTKGQNQKNAAAEESDNFNYNYVNDPKFKEYVNKWAKNNGMAIGDNKEGRGGTWNNEKNRQQASKWAKAQMEKEGKKRTVRPFGGGKTGTSTATAKVDYSKYKRQ